MIQNKDLLVNFSDGFLEIFECTVYLYKKRYKDVPIRIEDVSNDKKTKFALVLEDKNDIKAENFWKIQREVKNDGIDKIQKIMKRKEKVKRILCMTI